MLYGFSIVPAQPALEPETTYFEDVEALAVAALQAQNMTSEEALNVCEYLDCVDSRAIPSKLALYRRCTAVLSEYLANNRHTEIAEALSLKSFAAETLLILVGGIVPQNTNNFEVRQNG
jgi:hypothetical protein